MHRKTLKLLTHLLLLTSILFLILHLNSPSQPSTLIKKGSTKQSTSYAWNKVTYRPSTPTPPAHGLCPNLTSDSAPALVVSHVDGDGGREWLAELEGKFHLCVYDVSGSPTTNEYYSNLPSNANRANVKETGYLKLPTNRGHEAMTYLTYLIDNYDTLPSTTTFIHGSRWAWHNDHSRYDNLALLLALNITSAVGGEGYHNLRCDWSLSTCAPSAGAQGSLENSVQAVLQPWSLRRASDWELPGALEVLFGGEGVSRLGRTETLRAQCCAQFVVARENVYRHSRGEYIALRAWLLEGTTSRGRGVRGAAPRDDRVSGRVLSYVWHVLFLGGVGEGGVDLGELNGRACPSAEECYCRLYGRCGLRCRAPGNCVGEYVLPEGLRVSDEVKGLKI